MAKRMADDWMASVSARLRATRTAVLLGWFTVLDLTGVLLHMAREDHLLRSRFFHISRDRGFAESVQYLKFGAVMLIVLHWRRCRPSPLLTAWLVFFGVLLIDDMAGLHETVGHVIAAFVPTASIGPVRTQDLAELAGFALFEGTAVLFILWCALRADAELRRMSLRLAGAILPLIACGIGLDFARSHTTEALAEMAAMTLLIGCVHGWRHGLDPAPVPVATAGGPTSERLTASTPA